MDGGEDLIFLYAGGGGKVVDSFAHAKWGGCNF